MTRFCGPAKTRPALVCRLGALSFALVLASGCSTQPRLRELAPMPQRLTQRGYAFLPPAEAGWVEAVRNPRRVLLGKFGEHADENFTIHALIVEARETSRGPDLARFVKQDQARDVNPQRHRVLTHEVEAATHDGATCATSYLVSEDNAAHKRSGRQDPMLIEARSLTCIHPQDGDSLVGVTYSHRSYAEDRDPRLEEKALRVFATLQFTAP